jgi:cobalt-precorrin-5B (C1)-methyltransferase
MRTGFSTSACAAAAAVAGIQALAEQQAPHEVVIDLPAKKQVVFTLHRCELTPEAVRCGVIKDAGDDPDVTNGLEIQAVVRWSESPGIQILGGEGVGRVTLPGLPVAVGKAAINPGSHKLILQAARAALSRFAAGRQRGVEITVCVPEGERFAQQTMNPKLGIVGGISILGTDGLVRPYSAAAFRTSLYYELKVASENGYEYVGLATGKRSSAYLRQVLHDERGLGVVDAGDELGYPLERITRLPFKKVVVGGMIGKLSKLAQGRFQTHVQEGEVDFCFLSNLAAKLGAPVDLCERIQTARTAYQVQRWLRETGIHMEPEIARLAAVQVFARLDSRLKVSVYLFSQPGDILGRHHIGVNSD